MDTQIIYNPILQQYGWIDRGGFWHPVATPQPDQTTALDLWDN